MNVDDDKSMLTRLPAGKWWGANYFARIHNGINVFEVRKAGRQAWDVGVVYGDYRLDYILFLFRLPSEGC